VRCVTCNAIFFATLLYFLSFIVVLFKQNKRKPYGEALRVFCSSGYGLVPDPKPKNKPFLFLKFDTEDNTRPDRDVSIFVH